MIAATADHLGGLEAPEASAPFEVLWGELAGLDLNDRVQFLTLLAGRAVCAVVAGAMVAAVRDGVPLLDRIYGHNSEDDTMTTNQAGPPMEVRPRGFDDERCAGVLTVENDGRGRCDGRPIVAHGGVHHCWECFKLLSGNTDYDTPEWKERLRRHGIA